MHKPRPNGDDALIFLFFLTRLNRRLTVTLCVFWWNSHEITYGDINFVYVDNGNGILNNMLVYCRLS